MSKEQNKITKLKLFLDLDKELEYINEMNKQGWKLVYLKGGILYTFVKTQPNEYFTVTYTVAKEEVSKITTFASQCGYESIPHTMDGFGDMLYLTGKKNEVSQDFVSDRDAQIDSYKRNYKKFLIFTIIYVIMTAFVFIYTLSSTHILFLSEFDPFCIGLFTFTFLFLIACISFDITAGMITRRLKKKIKNLEAEAAIYE